MEVNDVSLAEPNPSGHLAEDIRLLGYAQYMAMMAQTDAGKHMLELFVEQENKRIGARRLDPSPAT